MAPLQTYHSNLKLHHVRLEAHGVGTLRWRGASAHTPRPRATKHKLLVLLRRRTPTAEHRHKAIVAAALLDVVAASNLATDHHVAHTLSHPSEPTAAVQKYHTAAYRDVCSCVVVFGSVELRTDLAVGTAKALHTRTAVLKATT